VLGAGASHANPDRSRNLALGCQWRLELVTQGCRPQENITAKNQEPWKGDSRGIRGGTQG
jgi:hypothetical protein